MNNEYMNMAVDTAYYGVNNNEGGPFGAVIVKDGKIISRSHNTVLKSKDATAHAEVNAIREASKVLNTHDLSGCILYTSAEPCPMCLSAIIWANIKEIYYACTREDAAKIGFRDDLIYEYLKGNKKDLITLKQIDRDKCVSTFEKYEKDKKVIY